MDFLKKHMQKFVIAGVVLLGLLILLANIFGGGDSESPDDGLTDAERARQLAEEEIASLNNNSGTGTEGGATDQVLMSSQELLKNNYGTPPPGFIWDMTGAPLSLGDKNMTPEEVVYGYLQSLSKLDLGQAAFYSRGSTVVSTYNGYYDSTNVAVDASSDFLRQMYRSGLISIQINGLEETAVFAQDKMVFTVNATMIDLTNKDFWRPDQETLFTTLYDYEKGESDSGKSEAYLFNYILGYYDSEDVVTRDLTFDLTLQKYADLDSGWLVSIDRDLDTILKYSDGTLVANQIQNEYQTYKLERSIESNS